MSFSSLRNFKEEIYGRLPWTYEAYKSYTTTISGVGLPDEKHMRIMEIALKRVPEETEAYKLAIGGVLAALNEKNHANYPHFAKMFIEKYKATDSQAAGRLDSAPQTTTYGRWRSVQELIVRGSEYVSWHYFLHAVRNVK